MRSAWFTAWLTLAWLFPAASAFAMTVDEFKSEARQEGFEVDVLENGTPVRTIITLVREDQTEAKGLLKVQWERRETWTLGYLDVAGRLTRFEARAEVRTRAPLGKWRVDSSAKPSLPRTLDLQVLEP